MAFCNSCGATLKPGTKFCNKCGAATGVAAPPGLPFPLHARSRLRPQQRRQQRCSQDHSHRRRRHHRSSEFSASVTCGIVVHRIAKCAHVTQDGDHVKVESPFGTMETSNDPAQVAKDLGIDIYPGAQLQKNGTATVTFGSIHTVTASFKSSDSLDKSAAFTKPSFANAMVTTQRRETLQLRLQRPKKHDHRQRSVERNIQTQITNER